MPRFIFRQQTKARCGLHLVAHAGTECDFSVCVQVDQAVVATTLLRQRHVEDFTYDKGLKLGLVLEQIGFVLRHVGKLRLAFAATAKAVCGRCLARSLVVSRLTCCARTGS
jgi:hypothetical protein